MERELIDWLVHEFGETQFAHLGIGDDCAILPANSGELVITCDVVCDGVHFKSSVHSPEQIGYKALAVNLSDLASMGAIPKCATVSLVIPGDSTIEYVKNIYRGMRPLVERDAVDICGGDTTVWPGRLAISVAAIGLAPHSGAWRIDGAAPGDRILVTGQLGGSIGGSHLSFKPRCDFAKQWGAENLVKACTDISDSLSLDLAKLARASGTGFELCAGRIPVSAAAAELSKSPGSASAIDHALADGEDFELIVVANPTDAGRLLRETPESIQLTDIGEMTNEPGGWYLVDNGRRQQLIPHGYQHSFASDQRAELD